ncbi:MAG: nucleotidyltransferase domain-containing protein [candidate division WOR-3 bacterium]
MAIRKNKIISEIKNVIAFLEKNGIEITAAYLFGSYAKGKPSEWSDIDVALVSDNFTGIRFYDIEKLISVLKKYNHFIEFHPFKKENFNPKNDLFIKEVVSTGIKIK